MTQRKQRDPTVNDRVMGAFLEAFPPIAPWNATVWRKELGVLKRVLFGQGYTEYEIIDAIHYAKMKGKRYRTIGSIPFIIEESKLYHQRRRELDQKEQMRLQQATHAQVEVSHIQHTTSTPSWLRITDDEEVE